MKLTIVLIKMFSQCFFANKIFIISSSALKHCDVVNPDECSLV